MADENAKVADPHVKVGLVAGDGGAMIWPQLIGFARAKELLTTGEMLSARQAAELGLNEYRQLMLVSLSQQMLRKYRCE